MKILAIIVVSLSLFLALRVIARAEPFTGFLCDGMTLRFYLGGVEQPIFFGPNVARFGRDYAPECGYVAPGPTLLGVNAQPSPIVVGPLNPTSIGPFPVIVPRPVCYATTLIESPSGRVLAFNAPQCGAIKAQPSTVAPATAAAGAAPISQPAPVSSPAPAITPPKAGDGGLKIK